MRAIENDKCAHLGTTTRNLQLAPKTSEAKILGVEAVGQTSIATASGLSESVGKSDRQSRSPRGPTLEQSLTASVHDTQKDDKLLRKVSINAHATPMLRATP